MKRPTALVLLVLAVLVAGLVLWWRMTSAARRTAEAAREAAHNRDAAHPSAATPDSRNLPGDWREATGEPPGPDPRVASLFQHLKGSPRRGRLSRQALEAYLESSARSSLSLLAAWQESSDDSYLREAAKRFPDDPNVQLAAAMSPALTAEHAAWRERLKQAEPENALPHWLAAAELFSAKQTGAAIAELLAANGKNGFNAHTDALIAERQAMFEAAGFEPLRAQIEARLGMKYDYIQRVQSATRGIEAEVTAMRNRGDVQTAQDLSVTAVNLGRMLSSNDRGSFIEQFVGTSVESAALKQIPTPEAWPVLGADAARRLAELESRKKEINEITRHADFTDGRSSLEEIVEFFQRVQNDGEFAALRWLSAQRAGR